MTQFKPLLADFIEHANRWTVVSYQQCGARAALPVKEHELVRLNCAQAISSDRSPRIWWAFV
ncbi:MAG: hypothetical protein WD468_06905 [Pirellulales bacterium]